MYKAKTLAQHQRVCVEMAKASTLGHFCYPTGTGKTIAEARIFIDHIGEGGFGVYTILAPRIMLAAQLFEELYYEVVVGKQIKAIFFSLHSGKRANMPKVMAKLAKKGINIDDLDDQDDLEDYALLGKKLRQAGIDISAENFGSGTKVNDLLAAFERARDLDVPLVICSTYHSSHILGAEKLQEVGFHMDVMLADEGHNAVAAGFTHIHDLPATKRFYFTATLKFTDGELGMNNVTKFGPLLDFLTSREAVARALILRPRLHIITMEAPVDGALEVDADCKAIVSGFKEHGTVCGKIGAKMLVAARGARHIREIREHSKSFSELRGEHPNLHVFEITSAHGPFVNGLQLIDGQKITREEFLFRLQALKDEDEAIILHYDILSEGIDVPGITGIMPLRGLGLSKFLQTFGRAARLHPDDRARLADKLMGPDDLDDFTKPYAWVILPDYGQYGGEIRSSIVDTYIPALRDFDFIPKEDVLITEALGESESDVIDELNKPGANHGRLSEYLKNIFHDIEKEDTLQKMRVIINRQPISALI